MIEKMERLTLYGLTEESHRLTKELMQCGLVQIDDPEATARYDAIKDLAARRSVDVYDSEQLLSRLNAAITALKPYAEKRGLLAPPITATFEKMMEADAYRQTLEVCQEVEAALQEIAALKGEISKQEFLYTSLEPWHELDQPLDAVTTRWTEILLVTLPVSVDYDSLVNEADQEELGAYIVRVSTDVQQQYLAAVVLRDKAQELWEFMRQKGGARITFDLDGTAKENMKACQKKILDLEKKLDLAQDKLAAMGSQSDLLQEAHDSTQMRVDRARARQKMLYTDQTFSFQGWVPVRNKPQVEKVLDGFTCYYEYEEPEDPADPPILLRNNKLVEPFETITEMYSMPIYDSIDPDAAMAPFYAMFFGMMLSDAGYGLILAIAGLWGSKKLNLGPAAKKMLKMFGYCGVSTVFWGLAYGSFFGDIIPTVARVFFGKTIVMPVLLDPLADPISLLILSFVVGFVQILVGLGMKAVIMIKRGHLLDAILDVGIWYVVLLGLPLMGVGMVLGGSLAPLGTVGMWMSIGGAAGLILTQGRDKKNPIMKLISGVMSLYDIVGYFSDLLSYSRIMALGLATAVIGQVVNTLGTIPGGTIVGAITLVLVFIIGHTLNMAINALGSYVHTSRLHYVEFFGKFFEVGGRPFTPLKANTKYINITNQEVE